MPRVYHEPDTVNDEECDDRPSAASDPGTGIFGTEVLIVSFKGS